MLKRRLGAALIVLTMLVPDAAAAAAEERESDGIGGRLFWGALTLVNGVLLASSVSDMRLYQDRAREAEAAGGAAGEYWDASSREKVVVGLSAASLLISLAGLKKALGGGGDSPRPEPAAAKRDFPAAPLPPEEKGAFEVLSFAQGVRYDTLIGVSPVAGEPGERVERTAVRAEDAPDPLDLAFRRALEGDPAGFSPGAVPEEKRASAPAGAAPESAPPADPDGWTVDAGSEWEAILAARREAGILSSGPVPLKGEGEGTDDSPALHAPLPSTVVPVDSPAETDDPVADLLLSLGTRGDEAFPAPAEPEPILPSPEPRPAAPAEEEGPADFTLLPWAVHVSSFRSFERAEKDEATWTGRGESVVIEEAEIPGKGIWFRVLVGNYAGREEAAAHAASIRERFGLEYVQARRRSGL